MSDMYDVVGIGSGPGGYVCAIKSSQLGLKTAIVEKNPTLGGTCLNIGCIPSKALLHASEMFHEASHGFASLGIKTPAPKLDLKAMMAHKDKTVKANVDGISFLMKKNKIDVHKGIGSVLGKGHVKVTDDAGKSTDLKTANIVIATGQMWQAFQGLMLRLTKRQSSPRQARSSLKRFQRK